DLLWRKLRSEPDLSRSQIQIDGGSNAVICRANGKRIEIGRDPKRTPGIFNKCPPLTGDRFCQRLCEMALRHDETAWRAVACVARLVPGCERYDHRKARPWMRCEVPVSLALCRFNRRPGEGKPEGRRFADPPRSLRRLSPVIRRGGPLDKRVGAYHAVIVVDRIFEKHHAFRRHLYRTRKADFGRPVWHNRERPRP